MQQGRARISGITAPYVVDQGVNKYNSVKLIQELQCHLKPRPVHVNVYLPT